MIGEYNTSSSSSRSSVVLLLLLLLKLLLGYYYYCYYYYYSHAKQKFRLRICLRTYLKLSLSYSRRIGVWENGLRSGWYLARSTT